MACCGPVGVREPGSGDEVLTPERETWLRVLHEEHPHGSHGCLDCDLLSEIDRLRALVAELEQQPKPATLAKLREQP